MLDPTKRISKLDYDVDILVFLNACNDNSREVFANYINQQIDEKDMLPLHWLEEATPGNFYALNRTIQHITAPALSFLDDDHRIDESNLIEVAKGFEAYPDATMSCGRILSDWNGDEPIWSHEESEFVVHPLPVPSYDQWAVVKEFTLQVPLSDGEEVDFYRRLLAAGLKVWWTPEAIIHHRIQMAKLNRSYFLNLHYRQGRMDAIRRRGDGSRLPPAYLYGQLFRAMTTAWSIYRTAGRNATLRKEMNVAYFLGLISGWGFGPRPSDDQVCPV